LSPRVYLQKSNSASSVKCKQKPFVLMTFDNPSMTRRATASDVLPNHNSSRRRPAREADPRCPSVLTIAGSDSGGGAGIQADLKTFAACGVHGLSAITALTAQDTRGVHAIHAVPVSHLARELDTLAGDFHIGAVKIGMLGSAAAIRVVARFLRQLRTQVVLDPVLISSSGTDLLPRAARRVLRDELLPLASLLTPNLPEAALLLGKKHSGEAAADARALCALGPKSVLLKGGHGTAQTIVDTFVQDDAIHRFRHRRLPINAHGTGCVLSAAIAAGLASGLELYPAVRAAQRHLQRALRGVYRAGRGTALTLPAPRHA